MTKVMYGEHIYIERYVIECERDLFGPFESRSDAIDFALKDLECPWTLRTILGLEEASRG